jgi:glycosyltransferase involved in cell wall biosynthesis
VLVEVPNNPATVGVVIRTCNESAWIGRCLDTLSRQRGSVDLDLLVVDSGSTDATVEIARSHGARIIELPPSDFDYSKALNLGVEHVRGDIVVSLSAHAVPVDDSWIPRMLAAFDDPLVAGVSSRQVPWPGAPWKEVERLARVFGDARRVYGIDDVAEVLFSNAASAFRRSVWRDRPFTLPAVEDLDWARRMVEAGWKIAYEPSASVFHSHTESPRAQAQRLIDISRAHEGGQASRSRRRVLHDALGLVYRDARSIVALDEPIARKIDYVGELVRTAYYYVLDYSRPGTTAERRRDEPARLADP